MGNTCHFSQCVILWLVQDLFITNPWQHVVNIRTKLPQQSWQGRVLVRLLCVRNLICVFILDAKFRMNALSWDITWCNQFTCHSSGQIMNHSSKCQETTEKYVSHFVSWSIFNSSPPSATYMRQWIGSALVLIMACRIFGTKPVSQLLPGICQFCC